MMLNANEALELIAENKCLSKKNKKYLRQYVSDHMLAHIYNVLKMPNADFKELKKLLRENKRVYSTPRLFKPRMLALFIKVFGLKITSMLVSKKGRK